MKLCKYCTEYTCGAQGSDNISKICGDSGTYFYRDRNGNINLHTEKEDERTMHTEKEDEEMNQIELVLNNILDEIGELSDILKSDKFPPAVAINRKNTAYGLDYASCIIMKYKKVYGEDCSSKKQSSKKWELDED